MVFLIECVTAILSGMMFALTAALLPDNFVLAIISAMLCLTAGLVAWLYSTVE